MLSSGVLSKLSSADTSSALQVKGIYPETPPLIALNHKVTPAALLHQDMGSYGQPFYDTDVCVCPGTSYSPSTAVGKTKEHPSDHLSLIHI
ncbi:hypothetical protein AAES_144372 [Amazona aestiva]|uniref:Uncharacterized protein n=1 Tax=Amazona aestiva TaxID=12930 RepID=A0A0Q3LYD6_AMAAE|nr:hypothetical protein AAES_144372 [Amazona aestiva]